MTFLNELTKRVCKLEKTSDMIIHHLFPQPSRDKERWDALKFWIEAHYAAYAPEGFTDILEKMNELEEK